MSSKSKKKGEEVLLLPGAQGWEVWKGTSANGLALALRTEITRVLDVGSIPSGELAMAFPVRDVSSLPFRAPTGDDALLSDLAEMHLERLGVRPPVDSGVLIDIFKVGTRGEESLVVPIVLAPPVEGDLPRRSPGKFDISARCLPMPAEGVLVWQELGRWVFALADESEALHFQALASPALGEDTGREIRLTLSQLQMQGLIEAPPRHCFVWVSEGEAAPGPEELEQLAAGFGGTATVAAKPAPVVPARVSQLLPADVRAERVARRKRQQMILGVAALALAYLGLIAFLGVTLSKAREEAATNTASYERIAPEASIGLDHQQKWVELQPIVEQDHNPVELLYLCMLARDGEEGLRLDRADIFNQLQVDSEGKLTLIRDVRLQGQADELRQATAFDEALKRESGFATYLWSCPPPQEKGDKWGFNYEARLRRAEDED